MTKEKIIILLTIILMLMIVILPTTVRGETEEEETSLTDLNNAEIEIIGVPRGSNQSIEDATLINYKVKITGVTLNPEHWYSVYFHEQDIEIKSGFAVKSAAQAVLKDGKTEAYISLVEIFLQKNADIYVTIVEGKPDSMSPEIILEAKKIEHPELLPKLGNRFHIYFNKDSTNTFFWAPNATKNGGRVDRTLNVKIGQITDSEIIKTIKENKAKGLSELLNYAKKVTDYNYVGTIEYKETGGTKEGLTSDMNLIDGAYYFAYIELDDEGGVYYPVEDIALYKAKETTELIRFSDKDFTWKIDENENPTDNDNEKDKIEVVENKEKNTTIDNTVVSGNIPQAGEKALYIIIVLAITLTMIAYIKYKQYKDI